MTASCSRVVKGQVRGGLSPGLPLSAFARGPAVAPGLARGPGSWLVVGSRLVEIGTFCDVTRGHRLCLYCEDSNHTTENRLTQKKPKTIAVLHTRTAGVVLSVPDRVYCVDYAAAKRLADRVIEDLTAPYQKGEWEWHTTHEAYQPQMGWIEIEEVTLHDGTEDLSEVTRGD